MSSMIDENTQFVDENGSPLVNAYIYIGVQNADPVLNPITIYSDRSLTTVLANPQRTDADGRAANKIWIPARYSLKVEDENNVQKLQDLDAGEVAASGVTSLVDVQGINSITANANPNISALTDNETYVFQTANANTGAVTLEIGTAPATAIKKLHDQALIAGDFEANQVVSVTYNEEEDVFELVSNLAQTPLPEIVLDTTPQLGGDLDVNGNDIVSSSNGNININPNGTGQLQVSNINWAEYLKGHLSGFETSNGTDSEHDINITAGSAVDSTASQFLRATSTIVKQIDVDWAEGSADGGFPSGLTLTNATWYHVFIIGKTDGTVDAGFDTSLTASNLLSDATGYTLYRRVGSVLTDGSSNITGFTQSGDYFQWSSPAADVSGTVTTSEASYTLSVPEGVKVLASISAYVSHSAVNSILARIYSPDADDASVTSANSNIGSGTGTSLEQQSSIGITILTNTSSQVKARASVSSTTFNAATIGWTDTRGKN